MVSGRHYSLLLNCMLLHRRMDVVIELAGIVILYMIEGDVLIDEISRPISIKTSTEDRVPTFYTIILVPKFIDVVTSLVWVRSILSWCLLIELAFLDSMWLWLLNNGIALLDTMHRFV